MENERKIFPVKYYLCVCNVKGVHTQRIDQVWTSLLWVTLLYMI